jgi:hypothetical protein
MDERLIDGGLTEMQGQLHPEGMHGPPRKSLRMPRFRLLRRHLPDRPTPAPAPVAPVLLDRSALLRELEVAVPAPERLVRWDTATRACPDCAENVVRSAGRCRHCGYVLA